MSVKKCHENSLTRSTSVVMSVMICALLEKSASSSFSFLPSSTPDTPESVEVACWWCGAGVEVLLSAEGSPEADEDATSFRTSVLAKRMVLS